MPYINLIQEERNYRRRGERKARLYFHGCVGIAIAGALVNGLLWLAADNERNEQSRLRSVEARTRPMRDEIAANERLLNDMKPRFATLVQAQENTDRWLRILDGLTQAVPQDAYLLAIRSTNSDPNKPVAMKLTGMAASQGSVGLVMSDLQEFEDLTKVELKATQERETDGKLGIEFEFNCDVGGTVTSTLKDRDAKETS